MSLYTFPGNPSAEKCLIAAKYGGTTVKVGDFEVGKTNKSADFLSKFPFGKVPAYEGDGVTLSESNAIAQYLGSGKQGFLGADKKEAAQVQQYLSIADNEIAPAAAAWTYPLLGWAPFNKGTATKAQEEVKRVLAILDKILSTRTYLVGEHVTLADIAVFSALSSLFKHVLDAEARKASPNVTRWFTTIANQPEVKSVVGEPALAQKVAVYEGKKEEKKPKEEKKKEDKPKEEKKPKKEEKHDDEDEDEKPKEEKKPNPLDELPPSPFKLDDWKRFYSNNETRPDAINYFWQHFDPEGYSMWRVDYKYNDELTQVFMSANLIGGFFQRLEACRKYAFGSLLVFGEDNKSTISGYFIMRGQEIPEILKDVPDYPSYIFTKVDPKDPQIKKNWEDYIAWDGELEGKKFADGKTFK